MKVQTDLSNCTPLIGSDKSLTRNLLETLRTKIHFYPCDVMSKRRNESTHGNRYWEQKCYTEKDDKEAIHEANCAKQTVWLKENENSYFRSNGTIRRLIKNRF